MVEGAIPLSRYLEENRELEQYFYDDETIYKLVELCEGRTACLFTPSVAVAAKIIGADVTLFGADVRLKAFIPEMVLYDANRGLHSTQKNNPIAAKYQYAFDTVLIDPPYKAVSPQMIANNANALLNWNADSKVYISHLGNQGMVLDEAFSFHGMHGVVRDDIQINYKNPPRSVIRKGVAVYQYGRFAA